jgi:hypothetical protein
MKEFFLKSLKKIEDNFYGLSKKKKITLIFLIAIFSFVLGFTLNKYTDIITKIRNIAFFNYLNQIPLIWIVVLSIFPVIIIYILFFSTKNNLHLEVIDILELPKPDVSSKIYEITIANNANERIILKNLNINWKYIRGDQCSISQSIPINSIAEYIMDIPLDINNEEIQSLNIRMQPMIVIPHKDDYGPGIVQFKIQIHYHFCGHINYHPNFNWDIVFSLDIVDDKSRKFNLFYGNRWREEEEKKAEINGNLEDYNQKLKSNYIE